MAKSDAGRCTPFNLGAGKGYSVLDMVQPRRLGDVAENYSDPAKAEELLGWKATNDLNAMCADTWRWQSNNPRGYAE